MGSPSVPIARTPPVLRVKPGCEFAVIAPGGFRILAAFDEATKVLSSDLTITAGTNDHTAGRHVSGEAFDLSVRDLPVPVILKLVSFLRQRLGGLFTVLYECPSLPSDPQLHDIAYVNVDATGSHIHAQVKKAATYPPTVPAGTVI